MRTALSIRQILSLGLLFLLPAAVSAKPPVVPGFARFHAGKASTAGGRLLAGELNCRSCHTSSDTSVQTKVAPVLSQVGQRVQADYLRKFIEAPEKVKPGTTMPNLFAGKSEAERRFQVEALVQFLATTGELLETPPSAQAVQNGRKLYHQTGCVACHDPQTKGAKPLPNSVPLVALEKKYSIPSLTRFLGNPLQVRPSGRMPHFNLSNGEATDVASYLLRNVDVPHKMKFKYYEGRWNKIPDFSKMKPKLEGGTSSFDVNIGPRRDNFGIRFYGFLQIPRSGKYRFRLASDDGSRLTIDGKTVVNNDGVHAVKVVAGEATLQKGPHPFMVDFFEVGGGQEVTVQFEGPGIRRQPMATYVTSARSKPKAKGTRGSSLRRSLVPEGRKLFTSLGCSSCHQLRSKGTGKIPKIAAKPWASLRGNHGCLDAKSKSTPRFSLSDVQAASLRAAISRKETPTSLASNIHTTLTRMNCYACHDRDKLGGPAKQRQSFFLSNQPEMGEEGRLPPTLTGVGAKLNLPWFKRLLDRGAKDRPYMLTRMPRFGLKNVHALPDAVAHQDRLALSKKVATKSKASVLRKEGRKLVGARGLSCIKCHSFRNIRATGIQATSLTRMAARLDEKWFHNYMKNPKQFRPTTRMPAPWPNGQTFFRKVLDGSVDNQVHAVWTYLKSGSRAAIPAGLSSNSMELIPIDEPIIYRNFIAGAGPRAIGVGYPERANLAFDANQMQVALFWHGGFIDAGRHWRGRGQGFQGPAGENVLQLGMNAGFAQLTSQTASWPTDQAKKRGYRFGGYLLNKKRQPAFLYSYNNIRIKDFPQPIESDDFPSVRRELSLDARGKVPPGLTYRAAIGKSIKALGQGWFEVDGKWKTRLNTANQPYVRKSGNQQELLVSVRFENAKAKITQDYQW